MSVAEVIPLADDLTRAEFASLTKDRSPQARALRSLLGSLREVRWDANLGCWWARCPCCPPEIKHAALVVRSASEARCSSWCDAEAVELALSARMIEAREAGSDDGAEPHPLMLLRLPIAGSLFRDAPAPRRFFLTDANSGDGVIVAGTAGLVAAEGGSGKSYSMMQLSVATVTGLTWFGPRGWVPQTVGPVLYLAGEEDDVEAKRRLYFCARAAGCTPEHIELLEHDLDIIPLAGKGVALTVASDPRSEALPETPFAAVVRELLAERAKIGRPYVLVIVDPLSRFAGGDVEKDSAAGTRFMQVLETFCAPSLGGATLACNCHTRKKSENDDPDSADLIRGTSALKDAARWALRLDPAKHVEGAPDLVTLRMVKRNGVAPVPPLVVCRPGDNEGAMRVATRDEISAHDDVRKSVATRESKLDIYINRIADYVRIHATRSRNDLVKVAGNRKSGLAAVRQMLADGRLEVGLDGVFVLPDSSGSSEVLEPREESRDPVPRSPPQVVTWGEPGTGNLGRRDRSENGSGFQPEPEPDEED